MTDLELARRVAAGDEGACRSFFDEYFPRLYRFARARLGGDDVAVEEVVQATLIRAVRKLQTFRGEAALFTWLCTLCRREMNDWAGRNSRRMEVPLSDDDPAFLAAVDLAASLAGTDPEAAAARREIAALVQLTLEQLPGSYGVALEWKYIDGRSVDEIAQRLGIGYKAAESVLTRARAAFREAFTVLAGAWPSRPLLARGVVRPEEA